MASAPRRVLDDPRYRFAVKGFQFVALREGRQKPRENSLVFWRSREIVFKICKNLEMLRELGIECGQHEIQEAGAKQHDLYVERNRVGLKRNGACQTDKPRHVLNGNFAAAQCTLDCCPAEGFG